MEKETEKYMTCSRLPYNAEEVALDRVNVHLKTSEEIDLLLYRVGAADVRLYEILNEAIMQRHYSSSYRGMVFESNDSEVDLHITVMGCTYDGNSKDAYIILDGKLGVRKLGFDLGEGDLILPMVFDKAKKLVPKHKNVEWVTYLNFTVNLQADEETLKEDDNSNAWNDFSIISKAFDLSDIEGIVKNEIRLNKASVIGNVEKTFFFSANSNDCLVMKYNGQEIEDPTLGDIYMLLSKESYKYWH